MTVDEILNIAENEEIEFIRLQFTDIFGMLKSVAITRRQLKTVLKNGCMFDGSSIEGFARIEESDMRLVPDLDTFCVLPFSESPGKVARLICDIYKTDGTPFEGDPRYVLKRAIKKAADMGYTCKVGPECEFFLFNLDEKGNPTVDSPDTCGYFEIAPKDSGSIIRRKICLALEKMGYNIEASHHENANAQHEIDFKYCDCLEAADKIITFKLAVKAIARENDMFASFMPKPKFGQAGSGMHVNISLHKDGKNVFFGDSEEHLSREAKMFIGGLLAHAKGFTAITNPLVNSYKRLVSGYEAPTNIAWSLRNRSPLIRIPAFDEKSARIEVRSPDPSCNPYLALALLLTAGLDGIEKGIVAPERTKGNIFVLSDHEKELKGVQSLPDSLHSALRELRHDDVMMSALGDAVTNIYLPAKEEEWKAYRTVVSRWEIENYLPKY